MERCQRAKAQNNNERHVSLFTVEAVVARAAVRFNGGNERTPAQGAQPDAWPDKEADGWAKRTAAGQLNRLRNGQRLKMSSERHARDGKQPDHFSGGHQLSATVNM